MSPGVFLEERAARRGCARAVHGKSVSSSLRQRVSRWYEALGLDRIEAVGWLGIVPVVVLLIGRGKWLDTEEARRWKMVLVVFAVWALGPFLTVAGFDVGLPLPQALARFVPLVDNARMPGRAMVCVYLALGCADGAAPRRPAGGGLARLDAGMKRR